MTLEFRILGPLEVANERGAIVVAGPQQRALLAVLLLEAGRGAPTERVIALLWGRWAPRPAATSLQNSLSKLRRELGTELLGRRPPGYVLRVEPQRIDARRFELEGRDARRAELEQRSGRLRRALDLWRGPALVEFVFDDFAQPEIRRL